MTSSHDQKFPQDARVKLDVTDDGVFLRTAIVLPPARSQSVDVVDEQGSLLCRLNMVARGTGGVIVDVIGMNKEWSLTVLVWDRGKPVLREHLPPDVALVSVDMQPRKE